jgi:signal transduction histidine kinase
MTDKTPTPYDILKRLGKVNRLMEVSMVLNSTLELEPLLRYIMDAAAELTEAETASILLLDPNTQELYFMAFTNDDSTAEHTAYLSRIPVPLKGSIAGTVILEGQTISLDRVSDHPLHYRRADDESGFQTHSLLAIPMRVRENIIGVLEAVNKKDGGWTLDDNQYLEILASQAAIALENAKLVAKLRDAYEDLSRLDRMKDDFIAIASHELRTPLGVILGYASFLKEEAHGQASEHANIVLNSALKMRQIIEDMTNLRYVKLGNAELELSSTPLAEVMARALGDVRSMLEAQGHHLNYISPPSGLMVKVDLNKMVMAITNLLNNAIKFSPKGQAIEFTYQVHDDDVWLMVKDQGIGLEAQHTEKIFEEFYQVEDHMTRRHNGMGLGLAIARAIVLAHGGRIWAESPGLNLGSIFFISLPLAATPIRRLSTTSLDPAALQ